jgi:hypothetical protein
MAEKKMRSGTLVGLASRHAREQRPLEVQARGHVGCFFQFFGLPLELPACGSFCIQDADAID